MVSESQQHHQENFRSQSYLSDHPADSDRAETHVNGTISAHGNGHHSPHEASPSEPSHYLNSPPPGLTLTQSEYSDASEILDLLKQGHLLMVNSRRKNGLILYKKYHAEFAGPGAAVGSFFDLDCDRVLPVGDLSLIPPETHEERQKAYLIRRQWIRLTQQFTDNSVPLKRAQMILNQFEVYFDQRTINQIPDDAFSLLVGVLPYTIRMARRPPRKLNVKVKT